MSSATGRKRADGQRLSLRMAALCGGSTAAVSLAGHRPSPPLRAVMAQTFALAAIPHHGDASARDLQVDGAGGTTIGARLYEPEGLGPEPGLLVYLHGGGWVFGSVTSHDNLCRFLARRAGVKVLSVEYRLAPEHPFPTPLEDARAAFRWAGANATQLGIDPARIGLAGDSAGGNLAASVALHRDEADPRPVAALLIYPLTDADIDRHASARLFARGPLLTRATLKAMAGHYAPSPRLQIDPRVSVIDADDLAVMPPTFIATAGMDPLRDQGEAFGERLRAAGVDVETRRFDNLPHGFASLLIEPDARRAAEAVAAAGARLMGATVSPAVVAG